MGSRDDDVAALHDAPTAVGCWIALALVMILWLAIMAGAAWLAGRLFGGFL